MKNKKNKSTLNNNLIVEMGVSAFDVADFPVHHIPYVSPHYVISVCHSGSMEAEYDAVKVEFHPHDIAVIYPKHTIIAHKVSPDYRATLIAVSEELYSKMGRLNFSGKRYIYEQLPHFQLTDSQYEDVLSYIDTIRRITQLSLRSREDIVISCIYLLSQIIDYYHDCTVGTTGDNNKKSLSHRFYNAIIENCMRHRDVQFYACLFHLTPKYFSKVIQQQTGHTAGYWIQHYVVIRAKQILTYEPDTSVQAIADRFKFPDQASFCRYFKRGTGMSPSQYRAGK